MLNTVHYADTNLRNIIGETDDGLYIEGPNHVRIYFKDIEFDLITTSMSTLDLEKNFQPNTYEKSKYEDNTAYFRIGIITKTDFENFRNNPSTLLHTTIFSFGNFNDYINILHMLNHFGVIVKYKHVEGNLTDERINELQNYKNLKLERGNNGEK